MKRLALCLLVACGSSSSSTPPPAPPVPAPATAGDPAGGDPPAPAPNAPALGEPCAEGDLCGEGATCVSYYGIAGPRGPEFKSCEIRCKGDDECPEAHACVTVADGPGQVCRPRG